jgi:hypothetical protein
MKSKFPSQSLTINTEVVLPNDTNHVGNLFGGKLMQLLQLKGILVVLLLQQQSIMFHLINLLNKIAL